jgi:hypothetical protein
VMLTLMRLGWGQENPAFRQLFTSQFIPGGTKEQADWFNELQRISASPEDAVRNLIAQGDVDVTALLPKVSVPTLVMHARDEAGYLSRPADGSPRRSRRLGLSRCKAAAT